MEWGLAKLAPCSREVWLGEQGGDGTGSRYLPVGEGGFATFVGKGEALVIEPQKLQQDK